MYKLHMVRYLGTANYAHDKPSCTGILLCNLGTPTAPNSRAVRRYLAQFLSDPRVIEVPKPLWWCILHGFILRLRPGRSARAYAKIWGETGSPLMVISKRQVQALQKRLTDKGFDHCRVELAMCYGQPSFYEALETLRQANVRRLLILPLYPQYSSTTTGAVFDAMSKVLQKWRWLPELRMINQYHDQDAYIHALVRRIQNHQQQQGRPDKLLFSFHGIPRHYFLAGDPYHCACHKTARLTAQALQLADRDWQLSFQSRFGPRPWLQPYTDVTLQSLAAEGVRHVQVICPGFAVDCLETLEEIDIQNRTCFLQAGGNQFSYIPALNDEPEHIDVLFNLVVQHMQGWVHQETEDILNLRLGRAEKNRKEGIYNTV